MTIGKRLKIARKNRNITQKLLAERIGTSRGVISNIELGIVCNPQPMVLKAICNTLNINYNWLLNGTGEMEVPSSDTSPNQTIISQICDYVQELSESQQQLLLDILEIYEKHLKKIES